MGNSAAKRQQALADQQRADEVARQDRIRAGTTAINQQFDSQFTDDFFNRQAQSFVDYARPQVDEQAGKAREQLTFALARNGTLDSSMRSTQNADLDRAVDRQLLDITDKGREYATTARNNVEQSRADLIANLTMTGDNVGASNAALARAEALAAPPAYSPIGQLFTDYTAGLAQQAAFERSQALGLGPRPSGGATLFGGNNRSVTVRR